MAAIPMAPLRLRQGDNGRKEQHLPRVTAIELLAQVCNEYSECFQHQIFHGGQTLCIHRLPALLAIFANTQLAFTIEVGENTRRHILE